MKELNAGDYKVKPLAFEEKLLAVSNNLACHPQHLLP